MIVPSTAVCLAGECTRSMSWAAEIDTCTLSIGLSRISSCTVLLEGCTMHEGHNHKIRRTGSGWIFVTAGQRCFVVMLNCRWCSYHVCGPRFKPATSGRLLPCSGSDPAQNACQHTPGQNLSYGDTTTYRARLLLQDATAKRPMPPSFGHHM